MTPKEKAKELVDNFMHYVEMKDFFGDDKELENAKKCTLICVDEIIKSISIYDTLKQMSNWKSIIGYWNEVKQKIEKL